MNHVTPAPTDTRLETLTAWLRACLGGRSLKIAPASADASFRRYFRVWDGDRTYVAMDAPPPQEDVRPFVAVARALEAAGLNVPHLHEADAQQGFLLLSDLGSTHYLAALGAGASPQSLYPPAAAALLAMQLHPELQAGLGVYDRPVLTREVRLFPDWFLARHLEVSVDTAVEELIARTLDGLVAAVAEQPRVFVHRDYHCRNLMVSPPRTPGILDFQDAITGPATYDLVSLYKDCYVRWPRDQVIAWVEDYRLQARAAGHALPGSTEFLRWFDLMGAQRHLKVLGIFCRLWYRDGKASYLGDLPRVLGYVTEVAALYPELTELGRFLDGVAPRFALAQERVGA